MNAIVNEICYRDKLTLKVLDIFYNDSVRRLEPG